MGRLVIRRREYSVLTKRVRSRRRLIASCYKTNIIRILVHKLRYSEKQRETFIYDESCTP